MNGTPWRSLDRPFWSRGARLLLLPIGLGLAFTVVRLVAGLASITNLTDAYPWGLWVAFDIASGIALAAGGFTTAAFIEIFGRDRYRPLLRTALLTAWLGYLMETAVLVLDLGRYWNMGQIFLHWQGNSVLFEVALCVVAYITVLTVELSPAFAAGLEKTPLGRRRTKLLRAVPRVGAVIIPFFVLAGVVLSGMHQSSLGALMVIAPGKVHALWSTPWLPVLFLLSAAMAGFPMVIIQYLASSRVFRRRPDMDMMDGFAGKIPWFIAVYAAAKLADLFVRRDEIPWGGSGSKPVVLAAEIVIGLLLPGILLLFRRIRRSPGWLFAAAVLVAGGVVFNRINVFLVAYRPPYAGKAYVPALGEFALSAATIAAIIFFYRFIVLRAPILAWGPAAVPAVPDECVPLPDGVRRKRRLWRILAGAVLAAFAVFYALVHQRALRGPSRTAAAKAAAVPARPSTPDIFPAPSGFPLAYQDSYTLRIPSGSAGADAFGPVAFGHRRHDDLAGGNCAVCHHRASEQAGDRRGYEFAELHETFEVKIEGSCLDCHADLRDKPFQKCSACHGAAVDEDASRPGLKAAYHLACIGCHLRRTGDKPAPTACRECHAPKAPNPDR